MASLLILLSPEDAKSLFQKHTRYINKYGLPLLDNKRIKEIDIETLYTKDRNKFFELINTTLIEGY
jgi:hypothetical protein